MAIAIKIKTKRAGTPVRYQVEIKAGNDVVFADMTAIAINGAKSRGIKLTNPSKLK